MGEGGGTGCVSESGGRVFFFIGDCKKMEMEMKMKMKMKMMKMMMLLLWDIHIFVWISIDILHLI